MLMRDAALGPLQESACIEKELPLGLEKHDLFLPLQVSPTRRKRSSKLMAINGHRMKVQPDILAGELRLGFARMDLNSDETSRDIDTAVLHRISIRIMWAEWFGLGSRF